MDTRFEQVETKMNTRFGRIETDMQEIKINVNSIMEGMDAQAQQLDIIRTEQTATSHALNRIEKRVSNLEEKETGYRIRDKEE